MRDDEIDDILTQASGASPDVDPALLDRISRSMASSLQPVRPLPASWILVTALVAICSAVAIAGALLLGPHGIQKMSRAQILLIFPALGVLIWLAAVCSVGEAIPGSPRRFTPWVVPTAGSLVLIAVFAVMFQDYRMERFVPQGLTCLKAGLLQAIPAALCGWLLLRRGFAVNAAAAGLALGAVAGLAGISMLELHCVNFEAPHVMLWHTAVLPLSAAGGALMFRAFRSLTRKPPHGTRG
jgi:hypothetical protein